MEDKTSVMTLEKHLNIFDGQTEFKSAFQKSNPRFNLFVDM